jgi:hypothetical protein
VKVVTGLSLLRLPSYKDESPRTDSLDADKFWAAVDRSGSGCWEWGAVSTTLDTVLFISTERVKPPTGLPISALKTPAIYTDTIIATIT